MAGSLNDIVRYRIERSEEMLSDAKQNLESEQLRTSLNRSYYAIFHAMRAANSLEGFDSSKHSGVIAFFNKTFLKTRKLDHCLSGIIKKSSFLREKSDYDDFYIVSKSEAEEQLENATTFVTAVKEYVSSLSFDEEEN